MHLGQNRRRMNDCWTYGFITLYVCTCLFSFAGPLFASLAVWTAASAVAASGVALRISHISCWHSLFAQEKKTMKSQRYNHELVLQLL